MLRVTPSGNEGEIWHAKCIKARRESRMRNLLGIPDADCLRGSRRAAAGQNPDGRQGFSNRLRGRARRQYVLTNDTDLQPTARLQPAAGSPQDNFARHMGHKVTVRGALSKEDPPPCHDRRERQNCFRYLRSFHGDAATMTPI